MSLTKLKFIEIFLLIHPMQKTKSDYMLKSKLSVRTNNIKRAEAQEVGD